MTGAWELIGLVVTLVAMVWFIMRSARSEGRLISEQEHAAKAAEMAKNEAKVHAAPDRSKRDILAVLRRHTHN